MGRLESVAVFYSAAPCSEKGMPKPMPCCNDVSEVLKIDEITKVSFDFKFDPSYNDLPVITYVLLDQSLVWVEIEKSLYYNYSPPLPDQDLSVLNQVFII